MAVSHIESRNGEKRIRNDYPGDGSDYPRNIRNAGWHFALCDGEGKRVVLDLANVDYVDSAGLGAACCCLSACEKEKVPSGDCRSKAAHKGFV